MIIFINGSVNAGKSTTSKLIADKLDAEWIDVDEVAHSIKGFDLEKDIPKALNLTIKKINNLTKRGKNVVANYVLRQSDYEQLLSGSIYKDFFVYTLSPRLDVVRKDRGRGINDWEYERIKYHYDTGIAAPKFGEIIDTSEMSLDEVSNEIIDRTKEKLPEI